MSETTWASLVADLREKKPDTVQRACAYALADQDAFWDWFLALKHEDLTNVGSLFVTVLKKCWEDRGRPRFPGGSQDDFKRWMEEVHRPWNKIAGGSRAPVPRRAFHRMIQAAVEEPCPSFNGTFIEPCVWAYGPAAVQEELLRYFDGGTIREKIGAANAFYWASGFRTWDGTPELKRRIGETLLRQFIGAEDIQLQRSILPKLGLDEEKWPEDLRPLVRQVVEIARNSSDSYLRGRLPCQFDRRPGDGPRSFPALPDADGKSCGEAP